MFALDLFNNDHERRLAEGAVDQLEQRRIDDLAMKMDELVARAKEPAYKKNPAALAALMKEFQKCKDERDSYYKVRNETMGYGGLVGEDVYDDYANTYSPEAIALGKRFCEHYNITDDDDIQFAVEIIDNELEGFKHANQPVDLKQIRSSVASAFRQAFRGIRTDGPKFRKNFKETGLPDVADKAAKMARLNQPGKVGSDAVTPQQRINPNPNKGIVGHAADWLRGQGGPGKEGPTYESELVGQDEEQAQQELGGGYGVYKELLNAWNEKKPYVIVPMPGGQNLSITRNQIFNVLLALKNMNDNAFKKTIAHAFSNLDKFMVWSNSIKRYQLPKEKPAAAPGGIAPGGKTMKQGNLPLQELSNQKKNSDEVETPQNAQVQRYLTKVRRANPNANSDLEAIAKDELEKQARVDTDLQNLEKVNARQDAALKKSTTLDRQQSNEIDDVERQIDQLSNRIQSIKTAKPAATPSSTQSVDTAPSKSTPSTTSTAEPKPSAGPAATVAIPKPVYISEPEKLSQKDQEIYAKVKGLESELKTKIDAMATWNKVAKKDDESRNELEALRKDMERTKKELNHKIKSLQKTGVVTSQPAQANLDLAPKSRRTSATSLIRRGLDKTLGNYPTQELPSASKDLNILSQDDLDNMGSLARQPAKEFAETLEEAQRLRRGDPVVVTAPNEFEGKTGEIYDFSPSGTFVIVDLYNHGKHSMHLSDVAYNDYADQEEEDDWYDNKEVNESHMSEIDMMRQDLELMNDRQFKVAYGISKVAFRQKYRALLNPAPEQDTPMEEGWSDAMVSRRTGTPRTPYSVYIKGKKWKDFENDDHAEAVANKLRAKFKADGRDPSVITVAPTDMSEEEQKPAGWGEFPPKQEITIVPPKKLKSGETYQDQNKYWQSQGQAPIYKTNEDNDPDVQRYFGKKRQSMDEFDASGYDRYSIYMDDYDLEEKFSDLDDAVEAIEAYKRDDPKSRYADYNVRDLNGKVVWRNDAWQDIQKPGKIQFLSRRGQDMAEARDGHTSTNNPRSHKDSPMTQQKWMQSIKQQYPSVKFAQNKTTMQVFAMAPGKGKVGTFDPRQQVNELEVADLVRPDTQTNTPPRRAYSIALQGKPGRDFKAEHAWDALQSVFPKEYPAGTEVAKYKVAELHKRGSVIVKTGIASEDIADSYVAKLSAKRVPARCWRIVGGELEEAESKAGGIGESETSKNWLYQQTSDSGMPNIVTDAKGRTQQQWIKLVQSKFPTAKILQAKMINGPVFATLPDGRKISWKKVEGHPSTKEQGVAEGQVSNEVTHRGDVDTRANIEVLGVDLANDTFKITYNGKPYTIKIQNFSQEDLGRWQIADYDVDIINSKGKKVMIDWDKDRQVTMVNTIIAYLDTQQAGDIQYMAWRQVGIENSTAEDLYQEIQDFYQNDQQKIDKTTAWLAQNMEDADQRQVFADYVRNTGARPARTKYVPKEYLMYVAFSYSREGNTEMTPGMNLPTIKLDDPDDEEELHRKVDELFKKVQFKFDAFENKIIELADSYGLGSDPDLGSGFGQREMVWDHKTMTSSSSESNKNRQQILAKGILNFRADVEKYVASFNNTLIKIGLPGISEYSTWSGVLGNQLTDQQVRYFDTPEGFANLASGKVDLAKMLDDNVEKLGLQEQGVAETALNPKDPAGDYAAKRKALQDLGMNKAVDQAAVLQRRLDLDREAKVKGVAEAQTDYQKRRQRERDIDAGRAVKPVPKNPQTDYAKKRAQDKKDMELGEGLMKEPTNRKEYLDQRDKLFRMMAVDSNPANKQIIKQALQDLEARYGNLKNTVKEEFSTDSEAVERAILNRIMVAHTDLLMKFGPEKVMQAAEEVAYNVGDVDEIGTSDVSAYVAQVKQILGVPTELDEKWSQKYKSSINCANPKGFSQKAHCAGRKK